MRWALGIVLLASTAGCHLVFPYASRMSETDATVAPDGPVPLAEGPPLFDGPVPLAEGPPTPCDGPIRVKDDGPLPVDATIPISEGPPLLDAGVVDVALPGDSTVAGCELTNPTMAIISAGCNPACGTASCGQQALWSTAITQDGTSLRLYCTSCGAQHFLSLKRTVGSWDLSGSTGFHFWFYTEAPGPEHWLDGFCHLTPTLFFYDTAGKLWTVQRGSKTQPPDPNASVNAWLEVSGPLKQPTSNWYPVGDSQFNFSAVTEIQIRVADPATPSFNVYVDGFTFLGPTPFTQCP
jgi:hypothetical protein